MRDPLLDKDMPRRSNSAKRFGISAIITTVLVLILGGLIISNYVMDSSQEELAEVQTTVSELRLLTAYKRGFTEGWDAALRKVEADKKALDTNKK